MTPQLGKPVVYLFACCRSARRLAAMVLWSGSWAVRWRSMGLSDISALVTPPPVSAHSFCLSVPSAHLPFTVPLFWLRSVWSCLSVSSSFSVSSGFVPSGPVSLCHLLFLFLLASFRLVLSLCVIFFFCFFWLCSVWSCLSVSSSFSVSSGFVLSGPVSLCLLFLFLLALFCLVLPLCVHLLFLILRALFRLVLPLCVIFFFCFFWLRSVWSCLSVSSSFSVSSGFVPSGLASLCHLLFLFLLASFRLVLPLCVIFFFCFFWLCSVWSCLSVSSSFSVSSGFIPSGLASLCRLLFLLLDLRPDITAMVDWAPFLHSSWFNDDGDGDGDNFIDSDV